LRNALRGAFFCEIDQPPGAIMGILSEVHPNRPGFPFGSFFFFFDGLLRFFLFEWYLDNLSMSHA